MSYSSPVSVFVILRGGGVGKGGASLMVGQWMSWKKIRFRVVEDGGILVLNHVLEMGVKRKWG